MGKLFKETLEVAINHRRELKALKEAAVKSHSFELAANLRELERKHFPETKESKAAKEEANKLNLIFRMVELNIPNDVAWLISETMKKYRRRRGNFDLKDAAELIDQKENIFL